jgi:osmotically inducible protein OsmC
MNLSVRGEVEGIDEEGFRAAAEQARDGCPVSQALAGSLEISVDASLR